MEEETEQYKGKTSSGSLVKARCGYCRFFCSEIGDVRGNRHLRTLANIVWGLNFVLGGLREEGNTELWYGTAASLVPQKPHGKS